jgi:hypothetical protein
VRSERRIHAIDHGLAVCDRLLASHLQTAVQCYGSAALGVIDLPRIRSAPLADAQLRVAAVLYFTSELERAGLPRFVEALVEQLVRGRLLIPIGASTGSLLLRWWRQRSHRFQAGEREEIYRRVFGAPPDDDVAVGMRLLAESLAEIGRTPMDRSVTHFEARVGAVAQSLGATLSARCVGIAAYAAREIVADLQHAVRLLRHPDLTRALGGAGVMSILRRYGREILGRELEPMAPATRARAGAAMITWVAQNASGLRGGLVSVDRASAVVRAAETWLAAGGGAR